MEELDGVGRAAARALRAADIVTAHDLVWTPPVAFDDLRAPSSVAACVAGPPTVARVAVRGLVVAARWVPMGGRRAVRVTLADDDGGDGPRLDAWWFFAAHGVVKALAPGTTAVLVGSWAPGRRGASRLLHPHIATERELAAGLVPRYGIDGVSDATVRIAITQALEHADASWDVVPTPVASAEALPAVRSVLVGAHASGDREALDAMHDRLAFAEAIARAEAELGGDAAIASSEPAAARAAPPSDDARARVEAALGYRLTAAQRRAVAAIAVDLARDTPMRRMVLGDVGSGKTAVALLAAAQTLAGGHQVLVMTPTTLLADQYREQCAVLERALGATVVSVVGAQPEDVRARAEAALARGDADVVVGTHALLRDAITLPRLGLVVVDEPQRLGVAQRLALAQKSGRPHVLSLTATPIPRTLALALRGDLATSVLDESPGGGRQVVTRRLERGRLDEAFDAVRKAIERGDGVYWIVPRLEGDEGLAQPSLEVRAEALADALSGAVVASLHGGMPDGDKVERLRRFRDREVQVLVATTVVEVGLDVRHAALLVVEGAELFGVAQLHQLRGRVGRGGRPGLCLLVHGAEPGELAERRLDALVKTDDGSALARLDLALRGAGDRFGTAQAGHDASRSWLERATERPWIARAAAHAAGLAEEGACSPVARRALDRMLERLARATEAG